MILSFPDVIGEYIIAPERFASNGLQFVGYFEPETAAPGEVTNLYIFLQSTISVPLKVTIQLELPKAGGFFGGGKNLVFEVDETTLNYELGRAEVGLVTIPVLVTKHAKAKKTYEIAIDVKVKPSSRGERIRPEKSKTTLANDLIDNPVGLNLVGALGSTFIEISSRKANFALTITDEEIEPEDIPLKHSYQTLYSDKEGEIYSRASQEIELRRVKFHKDVTTESLYISLFGTSTIKFSESGLPLRIGEAITLAKILTYSSEYFLNNPNHYKGFMLPIWERALEANFDTTDPLDVITKVGYYHLLKLAVNLSFGIIAQRTGQQLWSLAERQAVTSFIADNVETGQALETDFLYTPLLIAGVSINPDIILEGENLHESFALQQTAYQNRDDLFTDPDMAQTKKLYNQLFSQAQQ